ncbi:MAG: T9SS type A sorting domain-containing protein [Bacteroidales bacterium]|nr:T9SS type A sorting domain-containing protein [Bacteroidales bacterium]
MKPNGYGDYISIQAAINVSNHGDIIELYNGVFKGEENRNLSTQGKSIIIQSLSGIPDSCIIDCEGDYGKFERRAFDLSSGEDSTTIIRNISIINGSTMHYCPGCEGAAIRLNSASPLLENIIFKNNHGSHSIIRAEYADNLVIRNCIFTNNKSFICPGISLSNFCDNTLIQKSLFIKNSAEQNGSIIRLWKYTNVIGCTFADNNLTNDAKSSIFGWGGSISTNEIIIKNVIIANNTINQVVYSYDSNNVIPDFYYCNIVNNTGENWGGLIEDQHGQSGNISVSPLFADTLNNNYYLSYGSPCIDAGDPNSPHDPDGTNSDIGCFYYNQLSAIKPFTDKSDLIIFPNPSSNNIFIKTYETDWQFITIYNLNGIPLLKREMKPDLLEINVSSLPSGIYIVSITSNNKTINNKLIIK